MKKIFSLLNLKILSYLFLLIPLFVIFTIQINPNYFKQIDIALYCMSSVFLSLICIGIYSLQNRDNSSRIKKRLVYDEHNDYFEKYPIAKGVISKFSIKHKILMNQDYYLKSSRTRYLCRHDILIHINTVSERMFREIGARFSLDQIYEIQNDDNVDIVNLSDTEKFNYDLRNVSLKFLHDILYVDYCRLYDGKISEIENIIEKTDAFAIYGTGELVFYKKIIEKDMNDYYFKEFNPGFKMFIACSYDHTKFLEDNQYKRLNQLEIQFPQNSNVLFNTLYGFVIYFDDFKEEYVYFDKGVPGLINLNTPNKYYLTYNDDK